MKFSILIPWMQDSQNPTPKMPGIDIGPIRFISHEARRFRNSDQKKKHNKSPSLTPCMAPTPSPQPQKCNHEKSKNTPPPQCHPPGNKTLVTCRLNTKRNHMKSKKQKDKNICTTVMRFVRCFSRYCKLFFDASPQLKCF